MGYKRRVNLVKMIEFCLADSLRFNITTPIRKQQSSNLRDNQQSVKMLISTILAIAALAGSATAHFKLLEPTWRGDSFDEPASQWIFPCEYPGLVLMALLYSIRFSVASDHLPIYTSISR